MEAKQAEDDKTKEKVSAISISVTKSGCTAHLGRQIQAALRRGWTAALRPANQIREVG
jgi:hypothetical protein